MFFSTYNFIANFHVVVVVAVVVVAVVVLAVVTATFFHSFKFVGSMSTQ
jgi:hypothetical protein